MNPKPVVFALSAISAAAFAQQPQALASPMAGAGFACDELHFPAAALRAEATGRTVISFVLSNDGLVTQPAVTASSGPKREHKLLDFVALQHVRSCRLVNNTSVPPGSYSHEFVWVVR